MDAEAISELVDEFEGVTFDLDLACHIVERIAATASSTDASDAEKRHANGESETWERRRHTSSLALRELAASFRAAAAPLNIDTPKLDRFVEAIIAANNEPLQADLAQLSASAVDEVSIVAKRLLTERRAAPASEAQVAHAGSDESQALPSFRDLAPELKAILKVLYKENCESRETKLTRTKIINLGFPKTESRTLGTFFGTLRRWGLTKSEGGQKGGIWLTEKGWKYAEDLNESES